MNDTNLFNDINTILDDLQLDENQQIMPIAESSNTLELKDIPVINFTNANIGSNINDRFETIDSNFNRIVQSDYLRGKPGANYISKRIYFAKNDGNIKHKNSDIYNPVVKNGVNEHQLMDNKYIVRGIRDAILSNSISKYNSGSINETYSPNQSGFWFPSEFSNMSQDTNPLRPIMNAQGEWVNWHDNIASGLSGNDDYNIFTFITETDGDKLFAYSSLVYIFIDKRFEGITDSDDDQYKNLIDMSCAIYYSYDNIEGGSSFGKFIAMNAFPTITYNPEDCQFYWKIHGSKTNLLAQGPKGDTSTNSMIFCTYSPISNNSDMVKIEKVLVTYKNENGNDTTSFMEINEAIEKNYINLNGVKDERNHIKICAFCVQDSTVDNNASTINPLNTEFPNVPDEGEIEEVPDSGNTRGNIIMGTVCYLDEINQSYDGSYVVRFNDKLSFNHLFDQENFFNIMARNYHNHESENLENGYGLMLIPMQNYKDNNTSMAAHVAFARKYSNSENALANTLNILPMNDVAISSSRTSLLDENGIDSILLSSCPMNIYYDVNLIDKTLSFKSSKLGTNAIDIYNDSNLAQFDICNTSISSTNNKITPKLNIDYKWNINNNNVNPYINLEGLLLSINKKQNGSFECGVLDFIQDQITKAAEVISAKPSTFILKYIKSDTDPYLSSINNCNYNSSNKDSIYYYGYAYPDKHIEPIDYAEGYVPYAIMLTSNSVYRLSDIYKDNKEKISSYKSYSNYDEYINSKLLLTTKISDSKYEYNAKPIPASDGNEGNYKFSHELVGYPHKLKLPGDGVTIAKINLPDGGIPNPSDESAGATWEIDLHLNDKLIAPIINIQSNTIASPGMDFMRYRHGAANPNDQPYSAASYNIINTGLSINEVKHKLSYQFIYEYTKFDNKVYTGRTSPKPLDITDDVNGWSTQKIQTGVCGNMNHNCFTDDGRILSNSPLVGHLCNPNLMTKAAYKYTMGDDEYLGINHNSATTTGKGLPQSTSLIDAALSSNAKKYYKYYSEDELCTPIDSMYNIGLYKYEYTNGDTKTDYIGNDGYRTITLPYHPNNDNFKIEINSQTFGNIGGLNSKADSGTSRAIGDTEFNPGGSIGGGGNTSTDIKVTKITGIEILYQCEVTFDTLLDTISGVMSVKQENTPDYNTWKTLTVADDSDSRSADLFICDAISHSKFIPYDIKTQIAENEYKMPINLFENPDFGDDNGNGDFEGGVVNPLPEGDDSLEKTISSTDITIGSVPNLGFDLELGSDASNNYSGYRNCVGKISDNAYSGTIDNSGSYEIGAGYYYTAPYDLNSYYNRLFMNPYNIGGNGVMDFGVDGKGAYITPINVESIKDDNYMDYMNKLCNPSPYFIGVGLIKDYIDVDDFKGSNNKGIVYLCNSDDYAYNDVYINKAIVKEDNGTEVVGGYFENVYLTNDTTLGRKGGTDADEKLSPFYSGWIKNRNFYSLLNNSQSTNVYKLKNQDAIKLWYPKSTNIFNNPFMFKKPKKYDGDGKTYPNIPYDMYTDQDGSGVLSQFDLNNIKLAWRKFNINIPEPVSPKTKPTTKGYNIEFGELMNKSNVNITPSIELLNPTNNPTVVAGVYLLDDTKSRISKKIDDTITNNPTHVVGANICNDGIVWKDDGGNYIALHMTGKEKDYSGSQIDDPVNNEIDDLAGGNVLPDTQLYISKNGSKAMYKVDFTKLLLAAGKLCESFGVTGKIIEDAEID